MWLQKHVQIFIILLVLVCFSISTWADGDLHEAAKFGDLSRVNDLIAAKADVNVKDEEGYTALMIASYKGHIEVVKALIAAKADVNAKANNNVTALMMASMNGHREIVRLLTKEGAVYY